MSPASYTEDDVRLIREIKGKSDYYAILGLEKSCSVQEIRKAHHELALKVHTDRNKAPGSQDAFSKVSEAYQCLKDEDSRRKYDQTRPVEDFDYRLRRRPPPPPPPSSGIGNPKKSKVNDGWGGKHHNFVPLILLLPLLMVILFACSPFLSRVFLALI
ncbi:hypothetical protein V8G54_007320 [Vigna mungo]|uniref:J domain-containing protein n=1 Tax=Vigna mungo TaxID=3915 RepID=A0AAQ3S864_VIGMU